MGLVILPMWIIGAFVGVLIWRRFCPRKAHPRVYWVGVALIVLAPQWYFLAYGAVDWVRWHERCETMQLVIPPKIHTDVLGIVQGKEVYSVNLGFGAVSRYVLIYEDVAPMQAEIGVLRSGCTLEEVASDTRPNNPFTCYKKTETTITELPEYRVTGTGAWKGIPSTRHYTISHVRYELRRHDEVVGEWEEYILGRRGLNLLVGFPHAFVCKSGGMSAKDWIRASIETGVSDGSHN